MRNKWLVFGVSSFLLVGCPSSHIEERALSNVAPKPVAVAPFQFGRPDLVLLFTGGDNGMMETCDCSGPMLGGLSRRSGLVLSYRNAFPDTMLIDTGNSFTLGADSLLNDFHLHAFRQIGYDAMVLGQQEWALSAPRLRMLRMLQTPRKMEYLSTTVRDIPDPNGRPPLPLTKAVKREFPAGKVAFLSDLRPSWMTRLPKERLAELVFAPPGELAAQAKALHEQGYFVIAVCPGDANALQQTAEACPADVFVRGGKGKAEDKLSTIDGRPVVKVGGPEAIGVLAIQFAPDGRITNLEYRPETVDSRWPIDDRLLQTYRDYTRIAMQSVLQATPKPGLDWASSQQCGASCHKVQYDNWLSAKHSKAYATLLEVKRTDDPACLSCHTLGFGTVKGFRTIQTTPQLANVNCQHCHRIGFSGHPWNLVKSPPITEATCRNCHTEVTDPPFDYAARLAQYHCTPGKTGSTSKPTTWPAKE